MSLEWCRRTTEGVEVAKLAGVRAVSLMLGPILAFALFGWANKGPRFFDYRRWLEDGPVFLPPLWGFIATAIVVFFSIYKAIDIILARGTYVSVNDGNLLLLGRKVASLEELDLEGAHLTKISSQRAKIPRANKNPIILHSLLSKGTSLDCILQRLHEMKYTSTSDHQVAKSA